MTTVTKGVLVMAQSLRKLLRRQGRGAHHADDNTSRVIRQRRRILIEAPVDSASAKVPITVSPAPVTS